MTLKVTVLVIILAISSATRLKSTHQSTRVVNRDKDSGITTVPFGQDFIKASIFASPHNYYSLNWQADGNLVFYEEGQHSLWSSGTSGSGYKLELQKDGNLVIYDNNNNVLWNAGTQQPQNGKQNVLVIDENKVGAGALYILDGSGNNLWTA